MAKPEPTYTIEEANALVPAVRAVLLQLAVEQQRLAQEHEEMHRRLEGNGDPASLEQAGHATTPTASPSVLMRS